MCEMKGTVGIFSRSDHLCYQWLSRSLECSSAVKCVNHYYISNSFPAFQNDVRNCTFAILYHSKRRGRLNLTNVTDSLYDEELQELHDKLGKDNIIVVVDDVDNVDPRTLEQQPSLRQLAGALFLFSDKDRSTQTSTDTEDEPLITSNHMERKLKQIITIIQAHNRRLWWKRYAPLVFGVSIGMIAVVLIAFMVYEEVTFKH